LKTGAIPFVKAHGLGNDFLLLQVADVAGLEAGELARRACDRHAGVGADGIVLLGNSANADASFRIYNSDGSPATLSGNALRCAGAFLASKMAAPPRALTFDTLTGLRKIDYIFHSGSTWVFRAQIGVPEFSASKVPFQPPEPVPEPILQFPLTVRGATFPATIFFMGNPQCILFLKDWDDFDWQFVGASLERHGFFPDRANIGFVRVVSKQRIEARFWERGAGHTLSSGTGSCACAVAAHLNGKTERRVTVALERGELEVSWRENGMVELTGPAELVAEGVFFAEA